MPETFVVIKPDAVERKLVGKIITRIEEKGFAIVAVKSITMGSCTAAGLYLPHEGEPFFAALVEFMSSGPSVVMIWEHRHASAVHTMRKLVGSEPHGIERLAKDLPGTIRGDYAENFRRNVIHASDTADAVRREISIFFPNYY